METPVVNPEVNETDVKDTDVPNTETPEVPKVEPKDTVSRDTYLKVLGEKKTMQAKLDAYLEAERKAAEAKALEQGKFKELYEKAVAEQATKDEQLTKYREEVKTFKELLAKDIPDEIKAKFELDNLSIEQIEVLKKQFEPAVRDTPGSEGGKPVEPPMDISKMSLGDFANLATTNPEKYAKLLKTNKGK